MPQSGLAESAVYVSKLLLGLGAVCGLVAAGLLLEAAPLGAGARVGLLTGVLLILAMLAPWAWRSVRKADELRQLMHRQACAAALPLLVVASLVVGLLQAHGYLSVFNQIWWGAVALAAWAVSLMLADRPFH